MPDAHWNESKTCVIAADQNTARFARRIFGVNRRRHRHLRHRRSPLLRCPRFPSRWMCRNYPTTNCRCRTRKARLQPSPSLELELGTVAAVSASASTPGTAVLHPVASRGSKSATFRRPLPRMPSFRSSSAPLAPGGRLAYCAPQYARPSHRSSPNEAGPFIDHSSEIWNFCRDRPLQAVLLLLTRKVRP